MTCCGKAKLNKVKNIAKGFTALALGKKYEFTAGRLKTCRECDRNYWIARILWCRECKCCMPAKARVKEMKCPLKKWAN